MKFTIYRKNKKAPDFSRAFVVRVKGLEPSHREAPDPKSGVSTNFTTPAGLIMTDSLFQYYGCKYTLLFQTCK